MGLLWLVMTKIGSAFFVGLVFIGCICQICWNGSVLRCLLHDGRVMMAVTLWRVDVYYPVTRVHTSTVHSAQRREEAVQKALQHVPYALLEEDEYPIVQDVRVDSYLSWESA